MKCQSKGRFFLSGCVLSFFLQQKKAHKKSGMGNQKNTYEFWKLNFHSIYSIYKVKNGKIVFFSTKKNSGTRLWGNYCFFLMCTLLQTAKVKRKNIFKKILIQINPHACKKNMLGWGISKSYTIKKRKK